MRNSLVGKSVKNAVRGSILPVGLLVFSVAGVVMLSLIPPQLLKYIIDNNLVLKSANNLLYLGAAYLGVLLMIGVFDFLKEGLLTILGQRITKEIRIEMMKKLEKINTLYFSINESGGVVSRFTNDVDAVSSLFTSGIVGMMIDCFKVFGIVVSIWIFSSRLGVITLLILPVIYFITRMFQKRMLKAQIQNRVLVGRVNNHISESIKNVEMIKAFSKESYMEKKYISHLMDNYRTVEKVNFYDSVFSPSIQLIRSSIIALMVVLSSKQLNFLGISVGMVAASIELISNLFAPIENLGMELQNIQQAVSGIHRVNDFYDTPEDEIKNAEIRAEDIIQDGKGICLSFNEVDFQYDRGNDVLIDINLRIENREKVTFVGRTGVGKSTLFKLVMGLLKPVKGSVTINGIDVYSIANSEKRKIFGYVNQDFHIIKGTVAEQVSLRDEGISRDQIKDALEFVDLLEYVSSLEKGMDTPVKNENLFSQGQRQLLAIARAIVTNPPILLLDEITASLDSITEEKIVSVLQRAGSTHTILSISHRLSSMIASDRVVILENGRVKNQGSPERLLQEDEWYRSHLALEKLTWS